MRLRTKYGLYILALHIVLTFLLYRIFEDELYLFLASECLILLSLYVSISLYISFTYPMTLIEHGQQSIRDEDFTLKYTRTGTLEVDQLIGVYNEMIDRLRNEKTKTQEQSYFLENLIRSSPIGMIIMDFDRRVDIINHKASELLDSSKSRGWRIDDLRHPLAQAIAELPMYGDQVVHLDNQKKYKIHMHEVIHLGFPRQFVLIEEMTAELIEAEKKAYGKVIRMMAHEVNNSMGAVNSILESISGFDFQQKEDVVDLHESVQIAIDRNKGLADFTRNFADIIRLPQPARQLVDAVKLVTKMKGLFTPQCADLGISLVFEFPKESVFVNIDQVLIEQVVSNVIKNAIESIASNGSIHMQLELNPIRLSITDSGQGIDPSIESELFTPFFSTKMHGQGIGLMLIRDILMSHGFQFSLKTDRTSGLTTFMTTLEKIT